MMSERFKRFSDCELPAFAIQAGMIHPKCMPDGTYNGYYYAHCVEIDGKKCYVETGVRRTRMMAPLEVFEVKSGEIYQGGRLL